ncbi:GNAT family N-acetyltransferase [Halalkalibacter nanhaiisediminis]|uniref:Phosphinothricin acetyltransferase n=1 Tax=Halalkalibacter nanhaiisediminis TaxID=688079 RepID=A0A562QTH8_9BACI|nr:GNAT family N-acetyltransferase [Halalkalibacter nanhaiisediminis]TWI60049.1 phosphinothricin acetyltransferase [Halalkalibacter nanhaiisediminis]
MEYSIREMKEEDWEQVACIYKAGIATQNATFETKVPTYADWMKRTHAKCCIVADDGSTILGWSKISPVSDRAVYAGVGEVSVYVHPEAKGKGVGDSLLKALIVVSEQQGYWTLQSGIFPENISSIHLHKKNGFREVGRRERIGKMNGVWRDTLFFERRSNMIGID